MKIMKLFSCHLSVVTLLLCTLVLCINNNNNKYSTFFTSAAPNTKRVISYATTWLQSTDASITNGHWAQWVPNVLTNGTLAVTSMRDDAVQLTPLNICPPLYSRPSNHIFIDSNGFLSLQPFSMCGMYCSSASSYGNLGYYYFNAAGTVGDWPMISGFLYDLNPTQSGGTIKYLDTTNGTAGFVNETTVEYAQVPAYRSYGTPGLLNMQITLQRSGTIIIRYNSVLTDPYVMTPVTGLDLSKVQRTVLAQTSVNSNLSRWRLDPVFDPCQAQDGTDCTTCLSANSYPEGLCYWCASTKQCVHHKAAVDVCAGASDTFKNLTTGDCSASFVQQEPTYPLINNTDWQQVFYKNSLNSRRSQTIGAASVYGVDFDAFPGVKTLLNSTSGFPKTVPLPFNFSFFNFPTNASVAPATKAQWMSDTIKIYQSGVVKFSADDEKFPWPASCDPSGGFCSTNAFPPAIVPFGSNSVAVDVNSVGIDDSRVLMIQLGARVPSSNASSAAIDSPFCDAGLAATNTADPTKCAPAVGFEIRYLRHRETEFISTIRDVRVEMKARVFIDQVGNIGIYIGRIGYGWMPIGDCGEDQNVATLGGWVYPKPFVGISRYGSSDYSTISIPNAAVTDDQVLFFSPIQGCPSCNSNGACNTTSNQCICKTSFGGEGCKQCAVGYYGAYCDKCPACQNGGTCDDGLAGSGTCKCTGVYSGQYCEVLCSSTAAASCASCNPFGGTCTCGICSCKKSDGWYGDGCKQWWDPCDRMSLAGCAACNELRTSKGEQCVYCSDSGNNRCMSQSSRRGINASLLGFCGSITTACPYYNLYPVTAALEFSSTLAIIAFILLTILVVAALVALFCCRGVAPNPYVIHAVPGVPDFRRPPKERSVIQIRVVDPRRIGVLQGIPLKTVPILDLYRYQRARRSGDEVGMSTIPGKDYIDERIAAAQEMTRRFETAGPLPYIPVSQNASGNNGNNTNNNNLNATSTSLSPGRLNNRPPIRNNNNNNVVSSPSSPPLRTAGGNPANASSSNNNSNSNNNNNNFAGVPPELAGVPGYQVTLADVNTPPPPPHPPVDTPQSNTEQLQPRRHTPQDV